MKYLLLFLLAFAMSFNAWTQSQEIKKLTLVETPINIASEESKTTFIPPSDQNLKSTFVAKSDFQIEFVNFPQHIKPAFLYAVSILERQIPSSVPIKVQVKWGEIGKNVLAQSKPSSMYRDFNGASLSNVYYPVALAEKLSGKELNGQEPDIVCVFNKNTNCYFGTDGRPSCGQYDFVTVALHELIHGLGFIGFFKVENGVGSLKRSNGIPSIYDYYIYNRLNKQIANKDNFTIPSVSFKSVLESNNLIIKEKSGKENNGIYAPEKWEEGSSIYHYREDGYANGDADALMSPFLFKGEAIHALGKKTLEILTGIGWKPASDKEIEGLEIRDFEEPVASLPISLELDSKLNIKKSSVKAIFSLDNFKTSNEVGLTYNSRNSKYEGNLPLNNRKGRVQYYYEATSVNNTKYTSPERAPEKKYTFNVGPDYYPPILKHNPEKLVSTSNPVLNLKALAADNVEINTVKVIYKINGELQEHFVLNPIGEDKYMGNLRFSGLKDGDIVEYKVVATDKTARGNKRCMPRVGYYNVSVSGFREASSGYFSDFDSKNDDFAVGDFKIDRPLGFSNGNLNTASPYPTSNFEVGKYNMIALLKQPIIIKQNGIMSFDEVVLVEPGKEGVSYKDEMFQDFVIVEGSKDGGKTWLPVTMGYDSGTDKLWRTSFKSTLKSTTSEAKGHENMFLTRTINLTENTNFSAGDIVVFRFRLASNHNVNGWGWAIDNLLIQEVTTTADEMANNDEVRIYPNPVKESLYIENFEAKSLTDVEVVITDLYGKTILKKYAYSTGYENKIKIDMPNIASGIYFASITDNQSNTVVKKIIKN